MVVLKDISETVQRVADAIAAVLNVEVEIVDADYVRVAATGAARNKIGLRMEFGVINREVQRRRQAIIVPVPGKHEYCTLCPIHEKCHYHAQIIYPIIYKEQCSGSISLITFTEEQETTLLNNQDRLLVFLNRMADLISSKIAESILLGQVIVTASELQAVINAVGQGIIAVDKQGTITHFNKMAEKLLHVGSDELIGKNIESINQGSPLMHVIETGQEYLEKEILFNSPKGNICFVGSCLPVVANGEVMGAVAVIQDLKSVGKFIFSITAHGNYGLDNILGKSDSIIELKQQVQRVAKSNSTVLIRGESGTGKELFARAIHVESESKGPFIAINCAAIPESLLESELFGFEEGSFTGAKKGGKVGKFELAQQGTLFLDEIGDMPLHLQAKLLRILEDKSIERIGGITSIKLEARLITATNRDLEAMVKRGEFRQDLYYRLNVIPISIPSLKERVEDIRLLLTYFIEYYNKILNKSIDRFTEEAETALIAYSWPGNVRELQNTVEYCSHMADTSYIEIYQLPLRIRQSVSKQNMLPDGIRSLDFVEKELIVKALDFFGNSLEGKRSAAAALGIGLTTIYRKMKKHKIKLFSE